MTTRVFNDVESPLLKPSLDCFDVYMIRKLSRLIEDLSWDFYVYGESVMFSLFACSNK